MKTSTIIYSILIAVLGCAAFGTYLSLQNSSNLQAKLPSLLMQTTSPSPMLSSTPAPSNRKTIFIDDAPLTVEVADTEAKRQKGLSERGEIGSDGMLFVFDSSDRWAFWMKGMKFPLDFVWISSGTVVEITPNVKPPGNTNQNPTILQAKTQVNQVIEIVAGQAAARGIHVGSRVRSE